MPPMPIATPPTEAQLQTLLVEIRTVENDQTCSKLAQICENYEQQINESLASNAALLQDALQTIAQCTTGLESLPQTISALQSSIAPLAQRRAELEQFIAAQHHRFLLEMHRLRTVQSLLNSGKTLLDIARDPTNQVLNIEPLVRGLNLTLEPHCKLSVVSHITQILLKARPNAPTEDLNEIERTLGHLKGDLLQAIHKQDTLRQKLKTAQQAQKVLPEKIASTRILKDAIASCLRSLQERKKILIQHSITQKMQTLLQAMSAYLLKRTSLLRHIKNFFKFKSLRACLNIFGYRRKYQHRKKQYVLAVTVHRALLRLGKPIQTETELQQLITQCKTSAGITPPPLTANTARFFKPLKCKVEDEIQQCITHPCAIKPH